MSFFASKTTCGVCGKECGLNRYYIRASKAWCCPECFLKAGKVSIITPKTTIEQVKEYVARSQQAEKIEIVPEKPITKSQTNENNNVETAPEKEEIKPKSQSAEPTFKQKVEALQKSSRFIKVFTPILLLCIVLFIDVYYAILYFKTGMVVNAVIVLLGLFFVPIIASALFTKERPLYETPIKEICAEVIDMKKEQHWVGKHIYRTYLVSFAFQNEKSLTFNVPTEIFNKTVIGQRGILSYRERKGKYYFVYFSNLDAVNNG